jgi:four helix bundle protein
MQDFRRLTVWQLAHELSLDINHAFARKRRSPPGLRDQILRAVLSISTNIAEGCGKRSSKEFVRFLEIALASAQEVQHHLIVARDFGVLADAAFRPLEEKAIRLRRMLVRLSQAIRRQRPRSGAEV